MLFFSLTNRSLAEKYDPQMGEFSEVQRNKKYITVLNDDFYSHSIINSNEVLVRESLWNGQFQHLNQRYFLEIHYDIGNDRVTIHKPVLSGRPLYYHLDKYNQLYCSTHIHLMRAFGVPIYEDSGVLSEFLIYRHVSAPYTLYKDIYQVGTGDKVQIQFHDGVSPRINTQRYIPPEPEKTDNISVQNVIESTHQLLEDSFDGLGNASNEMNMLLSGGIDSSILFKICQEKFNISDSFSTAYPETFHSGSKEKSYADSAAEALVANHACYRVNTTDYLNGIIFSIETAEEPISHLQTSPFYWLFKEGLPEDHWLVVSGEAADSNFGTPPQKRLHRGLKIGSTPWGKVLANMPGLSIVPRITGRGYGLLKSLGYLKAKYYPISDLDSLLWNMMEFGSREWVVQYVDGDQERIAGRKYSLVQPFEHRDYFDMLSILYALDYSANSQAIWSKIGEESGRVLYYPYTNENLLNYVYTIPWEFKLRKQKYILKELARYLEIPEFIITRPKSGFSLAPRYWFGDKGILNPFMSIIETIFDRDLIKHLDIYKDTEAMVLWNMLNYAVWKRLHIHGDSTDQLIGELHQSVGSELTFA